jgi:hypothetical protein
MVSKTGKNLGCGFFEFSQKQWEVLFFLRQKTVDEKLCTLEVALAIPIVLKKIPNLQKNK